MLSIDQSSLFTDLCRQSLQSMIDFCHPQREPFLPLLSPPSLSPLPALMTTTPPCGFACSGHFMPRDSNNVQCGVAAVAQQALSRLSRLVACTQQVLSPSCGRIVPRCVGGPPFVYAFMSGFLTLLKHISFFILKDTHEKVMVEPMRANLSLWGEEEAENVRRVEE